MTTDELLRQIDKGEEPGGQRRMLSDAYVGNGDGGGQRSVLALDGDKWKVRPKGNYQCAGGNGFGINDGGAMYTLNTVDRHIVAILGGTECHA